MHIEIQNCFSFWGTSSPRPLTGASPLDPTGVLLPPRPPAQDVPPHFVPGLRPCMRMTASPYTEDTMRTVNYEDLYFHVINLMFFRRNSQFLGQMISSPPPLEKMARTPMPLRRYQIPRTAPSTRMLNRAYTGIGKVGDFRLKSTFVSETVRDRLMVAM